MPEAYAGFDWNEGNIVKCNKHGVTISEIETLFTRPVAILPDQTHSEAETRFKAIGQTDQNRFVLIVFTLRKRSAGVFIRPISARYMHNKEVAYYEKALAQIEQ